MDKYYYAVTVIGKDKPGIVASVAEVLYKNGFSIEDSSSTLLKDQFSIILIISRKEKMGILELKKAFACVRKNLNMSVSVRNIDTEETFDDATDNIFMISVYGSDKPGIVYQISNALAKNSINIIDLRTRLTKAEKPVYVMIMEVNAPKDMEENKIKQIIDRAAAKINVNYSIRRAETYNL